MQMCNKNFARSFSFVFHVAVAIVYVIYIISTIEQANKQANSFSVFAEHLSINAGRYSLQFSCARSSLNFDTCVFVRKRKPRAVNMMMPLVGERLGISNDFTLPGTFIFIFFAPIYYFAFLRQCHSYSVEYADLARLLVHS